MLIADMPALAAADHTVADALKAAGFTAPQEEAARIAFIRALTLGALAEQGLVPIEPASVVGKNIEFVKAHNPPPDRRKYEVEQLRNRIAECHAG